MVLWYTNFNCFKDLIINLYNLLVSLHSFYLLIANKTHYFPCGYECETAFILTKHALLLCFRVCSGLKVTCPQNAYMLSSW